MLRIPCIFCGVDFSIVAVRAMGSMCKVLPGGDNMVCSFCMEDPSVGNGRTFVDNYLGKVSKDAK